MLVVIVQSSFSQPTFIFGKETIRLRFLSGVLDKKASTSSSLSLQQIRLIRCLSDCKRSMVALSLGHGAEVLE